MWPAASPHLPPVAPAVYTYRMKRMTLIGAVALGVTLVWACSSAVEEFVLTPDASADDSPSESKSGSRLQIRPIVYEGDDGSVIRMGEEIFDTELGVVCEPMLAADGVVRCLPKSPLTAGGIDFADSDCTVPATYARDSCGEEYVLRAHITAGQCAVNPKSSKFSVFTQVGAPVNGYMRAGDSCVPLDYDVIALSEVPPSEFEAL